MTVLAITSFAGEMPRLSPDKLPQNAAQAALNCEFSSGDLRSLKGVGAEIKRAGGLSNPTGAYFVDDGNFLTWTGQRTAAKGTVIDDFYKRVYFTDESAYLRVAWQHYAVAGIAGWDQTVTYALGNEVLYPMPAYTNWSNATTYVQGDIRQYPSNSKILYRSLRSNNLNHQPDTNQAWWELYGEGKRYKSLQNGNLLKAPDEQPDWWIQNGVSLVGFTARAGVPVPENWTAKVFGAGTYNVNVVAADLLGELSVYNVPQTVADARAAVDGSTTGVANTNALIAVARKILHTNLAIRANDDAAVNTGMAYYASGNVKVDEGVVNLYPIVAGRLYSFNPPTKAEVVGTYEVIQLWLDAGGDEGIETINREEGS